MVGARGRRVKRIHIPTENDWVSRTIEAMIERPRRNRSSQAVRSLIQETTLRPANLVLPVFVEEGENVRRPIPSMPGVVRYSIDELVSEARIAAELGIAGLAIFPALAD